MSLVRVTVRVSARGSREVKQWPRPAPLQIRSRGITAMPASRTVIRWVSLLVAVIGWAGGVVIWAAVGYEAGVHPAFIFALSLGIAGSIVWARAMADRDNRDQERVYALGIRHGMNLTAEVDAAKRAGGDVRLLKSV